MIITIRLFTVTDLKSCLFSTGAIYAKSNWVVLNELFELILLSLNAKKGPWSTSRSLSLSVLKCLVTRFPPGEVKLSLIESYQSPTGCCKQP